MRNKIIITGVEFEGEELEKVKNELLNQDIEVETMKAISLIGGTEIVVVMIQLLQGIGVNAAYDVLKNSLTPLMNIIEKNKKRKTTVEISCNGKTESLSLDFELNDEQRDKLVDAVILKFTAGIDNNGQNQNH